MSVDETTERGMARMLSRAGAAMTVPGQPWDMIERTVARRRRRRASARAATVTAAVAVGTGVAATQGLGGLSVDVTPAAWPTGRPIPTGFPLSNSTSTLVPTDPAFDFFAAATTYDEVAAAGPSVDQLAVLRDAEHVIYTRCMARHDIVIAPLPVEPDPHQAEEAAVRAAADERQEAAFGAPSYAAANGYGIDILQWQEVVMAGGPTDGGKMPDLPPGMTEEDYSIIDAGRMEAHVEVDTVGGGRLGAPGEGCMYDSQQQLYGDYPQWLRSQEWTMNTLRLLGHMAVGYDPEMYDANQRWSSCMADAGWDGVEDRSGAFSVAWDGWWQGNADAAQQERDVAVADAECVVTTGYREVWEQTEAEVVAQVKADPDVIAYGALIEAALPRAEQLLAEQIPAEQVPTEQAPAEE